jgi:hypothetical protein
MTRKIPANIGEMQLNVLMTELVYNNQNQLLMKVFAMRG